ncbi:hydroxyethylthiazole kinase [Balneolales bacterium ANBcel1]|nr:hydroxyethylthiazole kinase [Balneolales bacterium ANBcel1]
MTTESLSRDITTIQQSNPLVHSITNHVVMNTTANSLLALGASPVMAHAREEAADMTRIAGALVLNIGTLSPLWVEAMHLSLEAAVDAGTPVVLDPVGAGATSYRTNTALALLKTGGITVLRGNASEILALTPAGGRTKGVDSTDDADQALDAIRELALRHDVIVSVSGKTDHIISAEQHIRVQNGTALMARITGMGCTASAFTGAFCAVNEEYLQAAAHAMATLGIAGEIAEMDSRGPGSFPVVLLDTLAKLDAETVTKLAKFDEGEQN